MGLMVYFWPVPSRGLFCRALTESTPRLCHTVKHMSNLHQACPINVLLDILRRHGKSNCLCENRSDALE